MVDRCKQIAADELIQAPAIDPAAQEQAGDWVSNECGDVLTSKQALAVYASKEHRKSRFARVRVIGTCCPICF